MKVSITYKYTFLFEELVFLIARGEAEEGWNDNNKSNYIKYEESKS